MKRCRHQIPGCVRAQIPYLSYFLRDLTRSSGEDRLRKLYHAVDQMIEAISRLAREIVKGRLPLSRYTLLKITETPRDRRVLRTISRSSHSIKARRRMMRRHFHRTRFWLGLHTAYHHCVKDHLQHGRWMV